MKYIKRIVIMVVVFIFAISGVVLTYGSDTLNIKALYPYPTSGGSANPNGYMAHNFYSDPILGDDKYQAFSIDFKADYAPVYTYWSLCNFGMDLSGLNARSIEDDGGAYCGLQNTESGFAAIHSYWHVDYTNSSGRKIRHNARVIYPAEREEDFDGEGTGKKCLCPYNWKPGKWYRMLLYCYSVSEKNTTYVTMKVQDKETGKWTLISTYDVGIPNSAFHGSMSQFMENYYGITCNNVRTIQLKNIYVMKKGTEVWTPVTRSLLSTDTTYGNKKGGITFGSTSNYFWGITCGEGDDIFEKDKSISTYGTFSISNDDNAPDKGVMDGLFAPVNPNPDNPDEPDEPETPDEPKQPDEPETPDEPKQPDGPEDPVKPEIPEDMRVVSSSSMSYVTVGDTVGIAIPGIDSARLMMKGASGIYNPLTGQLRLVKKGTVKLYYLGGANGRKKVTACIIRAELPKLKPEVSIKAGKAKRIKLTGTKQPVLKWESADTACVRVDYSGNLVAVAPGMTKVTAHIYGHKYECMVYVRP